MIKTLCFGEVLWDIFGENEHIGGAPFNVAAHLSKLGCSSYLISRTGHDARGKAVFGELKKNGVIPEYIQIDMGHETGYAKVTLDEKGVASYQFPEKPAYNYISEIPGMIKAIKMEEFDIFCFGSMVQSGEASRETLYQILETKPAKHIFFDVNIRLNFYPLDVLQESLRYATIVKLNEDELPLVSERLYGRKMEGHEFFLKLSSESPVKAVCVTRGANGASVYSADENFDMPCPEVKVEDTVGAGDSFSAAFLRALASGADYKKAASEGMQLGSFVASKKGAVPEYSAEIKTSLGLEA